MEKSYVNSYGIVLCKFLWKLHKEITYVSSYGKHIRKFLWKKGLARQWKTVYCLLARSVYCLPKANCKEAKEKRNAKNKKANIFYSNSYFWCIKRLYKGRKKRIFYLLNHSMYGNTSQHTVRQASRPTPSWTSPNPSSASRWKSTCFARSPACIPTCGSSF